MRRIWDGECGEGRAHTGWWKKFANCYLGKMGKGPTTRGTKKQRAFGRLLSDFPNLNDAERGVIAAAREGRVAYLGESISQTSEEKEKNTIRGGLVRFLALGGDDAAAVHEQGVQVRGAIIQGELDFEGCTLTSDLLLWNCELLDTLILRGARTRGIYLSGCRCAGINGDRAEISGSLFLRNDFVTKGVVRLLDAKISGNLNCNSARFEGQDDDGNALVCDGIQVGGGLVLSSRFVAQGAVHLIGAKIAGDLDCSGGRFEGRDKSGDALNCDRIQIGGGAFLNDTAVTKGAVRILGGNIASGLECDGAQFEGRDENDRALKCDRAQIGGAVFMRNGFAASGVVGFVGATIIGDVTCLGGIFGRMSSANDALDLDRARVNGTLWLGSHHSKAEYYSGVDLTVARIARVVDAVTELTQRKTLESSSAKERENPPFMRLDGLVYDRFGEDTDLSATARIAFLHLQLERDLSGSFKPQPWIQMVKVLRDTGHAEAAREVAIAYEDARRRAGVIASKTGRFLHWLYGRLVGYGHRPLQLLRITFALWLVFGAIYLTAAELGVMAPTNPRVFDEPKHEACRPENGGNWTTCVKAPYEYTTFNPWIYSLDLMLPFVDLQQDRDWAPMMMRPCAVTKSVWVTDICWQSATVAKAKGESFVAKPAYWISGTIVAAVMWFEILFGWAASLLLAAVLSGLAKKME